MNDSLFNAIIENIERARKRLGISEHKMCMLAGVTQSHYKRIKKHGDAYISTLQRIYDAVAMGDK